MIESSKDSYSLSLYISNTDKENNSDYNYSLKRAIEMNNTHASFKKNKTAEKDFLSGSVEAQITSTGEMMILNSSLIKFLIFHFLFFLMLLNMFLTILKNPGYLEHKYVKNKIIIIVNF